MTPTRLLDFAKWAIAARLLATSILANAAATAILWFFAPGGIAVAFAGGLVAGGIVAQVVAWLPVGAARAMERRSRRFGRSKKQWKW